MSQVTSHASVSFFEMPVALKFKNATQEKTVIVNNTFNNQDFVQQIGFIADTVLVDPEYWIISKNNTTQKTLIGNTGQGIVDIYPNPVTSPLNFYLHDFAAANADIRILNANGQLLYRKNLPLINGTEFLQLYTNHWARGLYFVQIIAGEKKIVKRLVL
jgi:hypothetical protein